MTFNVILFVQSETDTDLSKKKGDTRLHDNVLNFLYISIALSLFFISKMGACAESMLWDLAAAL